MSNLPTGTVVFEGVSKHYRLGALGTLRGTVASLASRGRDGPRDLWALKDVSFRVEPGESLGLIGPNGAGKTTALKLLSNITQPTSGRIHISGRTSSLIELGAGFHPELSGRDNIFLNGAILGLKRREIQRKLDEIVTFSELERFIDTPVKRYSSGMYVRLGFAVAAHVKPDVLLVDEVLAVGDASFRQRCIQRMRELQASGTTILFVSHNMHLMRDMCQTALLLHRGQAAGYGSASSIIAEYERLMVSAEARENDTGGVGDSPYFSSPALVLWSVDVLAWEPDAMLISGRPARIRICYFSHGPQPIGRIDLRILRQDGTLCCAVDSVGEEDLMELAGAGVIDAIMDPVQLTGGIYHIIVRVTDPSDSIVLASAQSKPFTVISHRVIPEPGIYLPNLVWQKSETTRAPLKHIS
jgi:ABC-type polysaccharide/polyol phosphate transport system ATPase subunit